jgi:hypothetical protein
MEKELFSLNYEDKKIVVQKDNYNVTENDAGISVLKNHGGWINLPEGMYKRLYGDNPKTIAINQKNWLKTKILPERQKALKDTEDEIEALNEFLISEV